MAKRKNLKHMTMAAAAAVLISQCPGIAVEAAPPEKVTGRCFRLHPMNLMVPA